MSAYHVAYVRDESGRWVASVREVRGCHTQGRTVDEARRRIREALALFVSNARSAKLVDDVKLPATAKGCPRLRHAAEAGRPGGPAGSTRRTTRRATVAGRQTEDERRPSPIS
jgi:predicted RNase H-like HicB family nuclease